MNVRVELPTDLKAGDLIVSDYGLQSNYRVYLSKVERVIDEGRSIVVGEGGHAHVVDITNVLCRVVGANAQRARDGGFYITSKEAIAKAIAKGGGAIRFETFTQMYDRMYRKDK